jgi:ketosteroid isomerase-like protein
VSIYLVIVEYTSEGKFLATGRPFRNRYIALWWFRNGRVCRTREFFNPTAVTSLVDSVTPHAELVDND